MIVPATQEHVMSLYPGIRSPTIRAFSVVDNGRVLGIAGIYSSHGHWIAFANVTDDLKKRKRDVVLLSNKVVPLMKDRDVYAIRDTGLDTSEGVLRHYGFVEMEGELWRRQSHL